MFNFREELRQIRKEKSDRVQLKNFVEALLREVVEKLEGLEDKKCLAIKELVFFIGEKGSIVVKDSNAILYKKQCDYASEAFRYLKSKLREEGFDIKEDDVFSFTIDLD